MADTDKSLQMRAAALAKWAKTPDHAAAMQPACRGWLAKLAKEVDPEGVLPEGVRLQRAEDLRRAKMIELARRSAIVRRARKLGR
jgi:hypothetical protein